GRRTGLKILWGYPPYGFESRPGQMLLPCRWRDRSARGRDWAVEELAGAGRGQAGALPFRMP
ncbi:MAG TPA: hypothetical protein P5568_01515, partial [Acidobacteriota bacterium]|nr:hypothetical protein [Acidobacteriota bacterium]